MGFEPKILQVICWMCLLIRVYSLLDFWVHQKHWSTPLRTEVWQPLSSWHVHLWMFCSDEVNGPALVLLCGWASLLSLLLFDLSVTMVFSCFRSGGFTGKAGWEALPFFFVTGRCVFSWQISEHAESGSVHLSRCDDKHIWVMVGGWGVVSRCNKVEWAQSPAQAHRLQLRAELYSCGGLQPQKFAFPVPPWETPSLWAAWECAQMAAHRVNVREEYCLDISFWSKFVWRHCPQD